MTTRDPDDLIRAYLDEGMGVLPDRVIHAIATDIHVTPQRARTGPWRFLAMSRFAIGATAAVIVVVIAATAWIGLFRPASSVGGSSPVPSALAVAPSAVPSVSPTAAPSVVSVTGDLVVGSPFPVQASVISAGQTYHSVGFAAPLAFTMQTYPNASRDRYNGETWPDGRTLRIRWLDNNAVTVHDGIAINKDVCHPTSAVVVPTTPAAVGQWLHDTTGITVTDAPDVRLASGATAKAFDVVMGASCYDSTDAPPGAPPIWFSANEVHRVYAVPDGAGTVLVITWPGSTGPAAMNASTDRLVESLRFE